jgi:His/Glu/Gln/Arg/opine family amino acid ABC transporter permease subunit
MDWSVIWSNRELYLSGLWATVLLSLAAIATGTLLGLVVAAVRTSRIPVLAQLARGYLEVFRGTPLLIQMLFIYFGAAYLSGFGITVSARPCSPSPSTRAPTSPRSSGPASKRCRAASGRRRGYWA